MPYLIPTYDPWVVVASVLIASFGAYVGLDLAQRVRTPERGIALTWWLGGSVVLGTGIWSMHFVGMLALTLPIPLGYTRQLTLASWLAGVGVSGIALYIASHGTLTWRRWLGGALAMGLGICAMHYTGMAAIDLAPGIVWNRGLVAASALIAVAASAAALGIFFWLRALEGARALVGQAVAAAVMGAAISGMHYTGMAAAGFPEGSICLSAGLLSADRIGALVAVSSVALLGLTLLASTLDARMQGATARLAASLNLANDELKQANDALRQQAWIDPLTRLPNRVLFEDRLQQALRRSERADERRAERLAVLFVDLDGFKPVNDSLGHAAGDLVLKEVALRLGVAARDTDTVARIGGDEFVLLMEDVAAPSDCAVVARRLLEVLARPLKVLDRQVRIAGSVGIVMYPDPGDKDKLVAQADAAMYAAKRAGGNTYAFFEAHMDGNALEQMSLQNDLRHAIERGELELHYQPKIEARRGRISGLEALLRWRHPTRGMVSPAVFIPIAERFGLIGAVGSWVIDEACRQLHAWADEGLRMRVAINLSVHQLRDEELVGRIDRAMRQHGVEASQLLCEITESVAMEDVKSLQRNFDGLARIGVFLSIDDFGTGYSSLSYLRQLPACQLKIDRSFVADIGTSTDARAIVGAVIQLAHALSLAVVAEGVETAAQRDILVEMGCDELQGYLFARPMTASTLLDWTTGHKPADAPDFAPSLIHNDCVF